MVDPAFGRTTQESISEGSSPANSEGMTTPKLEPILTSVRRGGSVTASADSSRVVSRLLGDCRRRRGLPRFIGKSQSKCPRGWEGGRKGDGSGGTAVGRLPAVCPALVVARVGGVVEFWTATMTEDDQAEPKGDNDGRRGMSGTGAFESGVNGSDVDGGDEPKGVSDCEAQHEPDDDDPDVLDGIACVCSVIVQDRIDGLCPLYCPSSFDPPFKSDTDSSSATPLFSVEEQKGGGIGLVSHHASPVYVLVTTRQGRIVLLRLDYSDGDDGTLEGRWTLEEVATTSSRTSMMTATNGKCKDEWTDSTSPPGELQVGRCADGASHANDTQIHHRRNGTKTDEPKPWAFRAPPKPMLPNGDANRENSGTNLVKKVGTWQSYGIDSSWDVGDHAIEQDEVALVPLRSGEILRVEIHHSLDGPSLVVYTIPPFPLPPEPNDPDVIGLPPSFCCRQRHPRAGAGWPFLPPPNVDTQTWEIRTLCPLYGTFDGLGRPLVCALLCPKVQSLDFVDERDRMELEDMLGMAEEENDCVVVCCALESFAHSSPSKASQTVHRGKGQRQLKDQMGPYKELGFPEGAAAADGIDQKNGPGRCCVTTKETPLSPENQTNYRFIPGPWSLGQASDQTLIFPSHPSLRENCELCGMYAEEVDEGILCVSPGGVEFYSHWHGPRAFAPFFPIAEADTHPRSSSSSEQDGWTNAEGAHLMLLGACTVPQCSSTHEMKKEIISTIILVCLRQTILTMSVGEETEDHESVRHFLFLASLVWPSQQDVPCGDVKVGTVDMGKQLMTRDSDSGSDAPPSCFIDIVNVLPRAMHHGDTQGETPRMPLCGSTPSADETLSGVTPQSFVATGTQRVALVGPRLLRWPTMGNGAQFPSFGKSAAKDVRIKPLPNGPLIPLPIRSSTLLPPTHQLNRADDSTECVRLALAGGTGHRSALSVVRSGLFGHAPILRHLHSIDVGLGGTQFFRAPLVCASPVPFLAWPVEERGRTRPERDEVQSQRMLLLYTSSNATLVMTCTADGTRDGSVLLEPVPHPIEDVGIDPSQRTLAVCAVPCFMRATSCNGLAFSLIVQVTKWGVRCSGHLLSGGMALVWGTSESSCRLLAEYRTPQGVGIEHAALSTDNSYGPRSSEGAQHAAAPLSSTLMLCVLACSDESIRLIQLKSTLDGGGPSSMPEFKFQILFGQACAGSRLISSCDSVIKRQHGWCCSPEDHPEDWAFYLGSSISAISIYSKDNSALEENLHHNSNFGDSTSRASPGMTGYKPLVAVAMYGANSVLVYGVCKQVTEMEVMCKPESQDHSSRFGDSCGKPAEGSTDRFEMTFPASGRSPINFDLLRTIPLHASENGPDDTPLSNYSDVLSIAFLPEAAPRCPLMKTGTIHATHVQFRLVLGFNSGRVAVTSPFLESRGLPDGPLHEKHCRNQVEIVTVCKLDSIPHFDRIYHSASCGSAGAQAKQEAMRSASQNGCGVHNEPNRCPGSPKEQYQVQFPAVVASSSSSSSDTPCAVWIGNVDATPQFEGLASCVNEREGDNKDMMSSSFRRLRCIPFCMSNDGTIRCEDETDDARSRKNEPQPKYIDAPTCSHFVIYPNGTSMGDLGCFWMANAGASVNFGRLETFSSGCSLSSSTGIGPTSSETLTHISRLHTKRKLEADGKTLHTDDLLFGVVESGSGTRLVLYDTRIVGQGGWKILWTSTQIESNKVVTDITPCSGPSWMQALGHRVDAYRKNNCGLNRIATAIAQHEYNDDFPCMAISLADVPSNEREISSDIIVMELHCEYQRGVFAHVMKVIGSFSIKGTCACLEGVIYDTTGIQKDDRRDVALVAAVDTQIVVLNWAVSEKEEIECISSNDTNHNASSAARNVSIVCCEKTPFETSVTAMACLVTNDEARGSDVAYIAVAQLLHSVAIFSFDSDGALRLYAIDLQLGILCTSLSIAMDSFGAEANRSAPTPIVMCADQVLCSPAPDSCFVPATYHWSFTQANDSLLVLSAQRSASIIRGAGVFAQSDYKTDKPFELAVAGRLSHPFGGERILCQLRDPILSDGYVLLGASGSVATYRVTTSSCNMPRKTNS